MFDELTNDVFVILDHLKTHDSQTWRRLYVRSVFAALEAILAQLKAHIKTVRLFDDIALSRTQLRKLNEFYTHVDQNGKRKRKHHRLPFLENVCFTLKLYAYSSYVFTEIDISTPGWHALERSVKVRNRITHPKTPEGIIVSNAEFKQALIAFRWFMQTHANLEKQCIRTMKKQLKGVLKTAERLKRAERSSVKNVQNNFT